MRQDQADSDDDNGLSLHWWQQDNEEVWGDLMGNLEDQLPLDLDLHGQDIENRLTHLVAQGLNTVTADLTSASGTPLETRLRILAHWISRRTCKRVFHGRIRNLLTSAAHQASSFPGPLGRTRPP